MAAETPRSVRSSALRFLVAGGLNTLATGALVSLLAQVIDPRAAYTIAFALGIVLAVSLAGGFVFGVRMTRALAVRYVLMYLVVYLLGLLAVTAATDAGLSRDWTGLVVLVTAPLTFLGGRLLLTRRRPTGQTTVERTPA